MVGTRAAALAAFEKVRCLALGASEPRVQRSRRTLSFHRIHTDAVISSPAAKKARRESGVGATGPDTVVVLDYGSQYTQLITRRVRELGVYSVLLPGDADMVRLDSRVVVYTDSCREYRPE